MNIKFLGIGAAFDPDLTNTSILIDSETKLLLDCGYSASHKVWHHNPDPDFPDAIYFSHSHFDHYYGITSIFMRAMAYGRKKDLTIICQKGMKDMIISLVALGSNHTLDKLGYKVNFIEVEAGQTIEFNEFKLGFALTDHPRQNYAISISKDDTKICYSGDGQFTEASKNLFENADLLIHETFQFEENMRGHGCVTEVEKMAKEQGIKALACVHLHPEHRPDIKKRVSEIDSQINIFVPEPGQQFSFD